MNPWLIVLAVIAGLLFADSVIIGLIVLARARYIRRHRATDVPSSAPDWDRYRGNASDDITWDWPKR